MTAKESGCTGWAASTSKVTGKTAGAKAPGCLLFGLPESCIRGPQREGLFLIPNSTGMSVISI